MDFPSESVAYDDLHGGLAAGSAVVTSTRRLARALRLAHARQSSEPSWPTPDAVPWSAWLDASFRDLRDFGAAGLQRPCLDELQAIATWEQLFSEDPLAEQLLMPAGAIEGFREAWALAHQWGLSWPLLAARAGEDCQAFLRLASAYRHRLAELGLIDPAMLPELLAPMLAGRAGPPVLFAGFDAINPAQRAVVRALGSRARWVTPAARRSAPQRLAFPDARSELAAAAAWARARLDHNPGASIAIVVPDIEAAAPMLEDMLDEALTPARLWPGNADMPRPWNLSLGQPLAELPVVAAAFLACELIRESFDAAAASRLLRSPFIGGFGEEGAQRARFEAWLRQAGGDRISPAALLGWLGGQRRAPPCPRLEAGLRGMLDELHGAPRRRLPSAWAAALTRALRHLGWPGDQSLDSINWQLVQAWAGLLESFSRLDAFVGAITAADALARLRRIAAAQLFQPETPDLPVQVLGLLETAGLEFDALWVSGMHDGVLPAPLRPCPLLPAGLQRERQMPRSCPDTELALARKLVGRLAAAAPEVSFSYPLRHEDEPLRPSPVIATLPLAEHCAVAVPGVAAAGFAARKVIGVDDFRGPPTSGEIAGGTAVLAAQSACPFKAFATHRLGAQPLESAFAGVDGRARGSFLHLALHELWGELGDRAQLAALGPAERAARVRAALARAADRALAGQPRGLVEVELADGAHRIDELLEVELARPHFEVFKREHPLVIEQGGLRLNGKVDRVDRCGEQLVIIDYKTGQAGIGGWQGERPAEPQMPLYALQFRDRLAALVYASLKPGDVGLKGIAASDELLGDTLPQRSVLSPEKWRDQLERWQEVLEALATSFAGGDARVDPLRVEGSGSSCERCHLATLCRRDELLRAGAIGDD